MSKWKNLYYKPKTYCIILFYIIHWNKGIIHHVRWYSKLGVGSDSNRIWSGLPGSLLFWKNRPFTSLRNKTTNKHSSNDHNAFNYSPPEVVNENKVNISLDALWYNIQRFRSIFARMRWPDQKAGMAKAWIVNCFKISTKRFIQLWVIFLQFTRARWSIFWSWIFGSFSLAFA